MTNYTKKAFTGIGLVIVMNALANIISYFTRVFLARNLTAAEYGLFYAVFTFILFWLFFRDLGLGTALVKYIAEFRVKEKFNLIKTAILSTTFFQLLSSAIFSSIFYLLADFLAQSYFKSPLSSLMLKILIIYIFLSVLFKVPKEVLRGFQKFKQFAFFEFSKNLIVFLLILIFFSFGIKDVFAPVYAYVLVSPILFIIFGFMALKAFPIFKYKVESFKPTTKKLFLFGLPVLLTGVGGKVIGYIDTLFLTHYVSLEQVGIYNVVLPSAMLFLFLGISISSVIFPMVSELWVKKDKKKLSQGLYLLHKYSFFILIPPLFTVFVFSDFFINLLFGEVYVAGSLAFKILLIGVMLYVVAGINNNIIAATNKPGQVTKIILFAALINVLLNILLIPKYGINGAAIATSASYLAVMILSTRGAIKRINARFQYIIWFKLVMLGIVFVFLLYYMDSILPFNIWLNLILSVLIAGTVYIILAYLFKVINIKEIKKYISIALNK